jgi:hypothetical protein
MIRSTVELHPSRVSVCQRSNDRSPWLDCRQQPYRSAFFLAASDARAGRPYVWHMNRPFIIRCGKTILPACASPIRGIVKVRNVPFTAPTSRKNRGKEGDTASAPPV